MLAPRASPGAVVKSETYCSIKRDESKGNKGGRRREQGCRIRQEAITYTCSGRLLGGPHACSIVESTGVYREWSSVAIDDEEEEEEEEEEDEEGGEEDGEDAASQPMINGARAPSQASDDAGGQGAPAPRDPTTRRRS